MLLLQQSESTEAQRRIPIYLVDATNGYTPETGLSSGFTVEVSENGAAQAGGSGSITEIGEGQYYYTATAAELSTLGFLAISVRHASCRDFFAVAQVVPWDPYAITNMGLTDITGIKTETDKLTFDGSNILADVMAMNADVITASAFTQAAADKVWSTAARSLTDKAGFTISGTTQTFDALDTLLDAAHGAGSWLSATGFSVPNEYDTVIAALQTDLDNPNQYKATGFSTHAAADIWSVGTRSLTDKAGFTISGTLQTLDALENLSSSDVQTVIENNDLDHLIQIAAGVETPTVDSYLDQIMNKAGTQDFDPTTDSLEAIRDRGDAEWDTATGFSVPNEYDTVIAALQTDLDNPNQYKATGFSTHTAADVWTAGSRALSVPNDYKATGFSTHAAADVWSVGTRQLSGTISDFDGLDTALDSAHGAGSWLTGGGGSGIVIQVIPSIPSSIDVSNTKLIRLALYVIDASDDLPTTGEITPGTITIDRSADGGTSWSNVVNVAACSEHAGCIYYDEVFDSGSGYTSADMIRITFKGQKVTIAANDFEIADVTDGMIFTTRMDSGLSGGGPSVQDIWEYATGGGRTLSTPADYKATGFSTHSAADIWSVGTRSLTDKAGFTISGTTQTFDALDTLLDSAHGAGSWLSATGFSTHAAADIWTAGSRELSTPANYKATGFSVPNEYDVVIAALQTDLDNPNQYKATGFSTHAAADVWAVGTKVITGGALTTPNDYKADVSALATEANATTNRTSIITEVDANETKIDALQSDALRLKGLNGEFIVAEYTFVGDDNTITEYWQYDTLSNFNTHNKSTGLIGSWILNNTFASGKPTIIKSKRLS